MDFGLSEEQEILRKFARDFLTEKFNKKTINALEAGDGFSVDIWQEMAGLGWQGLAFPENYGGAGMSLLDLGILLEEMGKAGAVSPYVSTVVLGAIPVFKFGTEEQKREILPQVSSGSLLMTSAIFESDCKLRPDCIGTKATASGGEFILNGTKLFVPYAHVSHKFICLARTANSNDESKNFTLFMVNTQDPGIKVTLHKTRTDKICKVEMRDVKVPQKDILGGPNTGWDLAKQIMNLLVVARCCQMLGQAQKAFDMTIDYVKERKQYGRPVGTFQAMQHHAADLLTDVYGMRVAIYRAAWTLAQGIPCDREIAIARKYTLDASEEIINLTHQMHGAIGYTLDYDLRLYTIPMKSYQLELFNLDYYDEILSPNLV